MSHASGTRLGPCPIVDLPGGGGLGGVYRAHDARLGRDVAMPTHEGGRMRESRGRE